MKIRTMLMLAAMAAAVPATQALAQKSQAFSAIIADASRPEADKARDADRKPEVMLEFARVKPGMKIFEILPGGGYFTRMFSLEVGAKGAVYGYVPEEMVAARFKPLDEIAKLAAEPGRGNVHAVHFPLMAQPGPEFLHAIDLVWTSQNYHDFHNLAGFDPVAYNKAVYAMLKPGGTYIVLDHAALPGADASTTKTFHRIDAGLVRKEVEAAGFIFDGETRVLTNPQDPRNIPVFDPSIRGKTDQFVFRFRKPG